MVGIADEAELDRLEQQVEGGGGNIAEYLALLRKLKVRRSDKVTQHGLKLLNSASARSKLGSNVWTVYEQVAVAAMDDGNLEVAKQSIGALRKKFPDSVRVGRLRGMLFEASGAWQQADKLYADYLEDQGADVFFHKRRVAVAKAQGKWAEAVDLLNKYLETYMADYDAWRELGEIYTSLQMYKQALFCVEELLLSQPANILYHLRYAELLYTIGGLDNFRAARKYYAAAIELSNGKNVRALYGVVLCGAAINQTKGRSKEEDSSEIVALASASLIREYKLKAPKKVPLLSSVLDKQKLASSS